MGIKYRGNNSGITMTSLTQTMANTTEVTYISIYDKPKRGKGRPTTCKLSDEEKLEWLRQDCQTYYYADPERREKARLKSKTYYDINLEKERERTRLEYARKKENAKSTNLENQLFLAF